MLKLSLKDNEIFTNLEIIHYEYESYVQILEYMEANNQYDEEFWTLWKKYMELYAIYETLKKSIHINIVLPVTGNNFHGHWEINFDEEEITIFDNNN